MKKMLPVAPPPPLALTDKLVGSTAIIPLFYAFSYIVYKFSYYPEFVALSCKKSKQSVKIVFDEINWDVLVEKIWKYRLQKFKKYLLRKSKYIW